MVPICPCIRPVSGSAIHIFLEIISSTSYFTLSWLDFHRFNISIEGLDAFGRRRKIFICWLFQVLKLLQSSSKSPECYEQNQNMQGHLAQLLIVLTCKQNYSEMEWFIQDWIWICDLPGDPELLDREVNEYLQRN